MRTRSSQKSARGIGSTDAVIVDVSELALDGVGIP